MRKKFLTQAFICYFSLLLSSFLSAYEFSEKEKKVHDLWWLDKNSSVSANPYWREAFKFQKKSFPLLENEGAIKRMLENSPYVEFLKVSSHLVTKETRQISFTIAKKYLHYRAKEISRIYSVEELEKDREGNLILPVYGLYHGHKNEIRISLDHPEVSYLEMVETEAPAKNHSYAHIQVENFIDKDSKPSFDFFLLKSRKSGVGIMDIDGEIRWNYPVPLFGWANLVKKNKLFMFGIDHLYHIDFDWTRKKYKVEPSQYDELMRHHGLHSGKEGSFVMMSGRRKSDGVFIDQSIILEIDAFGKVLKTWDLGEILSQYMEEKGDNSSLFVREGTDWFHMNALLYTGEEDNSLIVSSRENFVIKIDYETGAIRWIFGDRTKYWYSFPSLADLSLETDGRYPIGQHAVSILGEDPHRLMFFNNGHPSVKNPEGTPEGSVYPTSSVNVYQIDEENKKAAVRFHYDLGYKSHTRSSAYRSRDNLYTLIMAAHAHELTLIENKPTPKLLLKVNFSSEIEDKNLWNVAIIEEGFPAFQLTP